MSMLKLEIGALAQRLTLHRPTRHGDLIALIVVVAAPVVLLLWLLPLQFVLPVLSIVSFIIAGIAALLAYGKKLDRHAPGTTLWDVAGVFTGIWIAAGLLSGPKRLSELFARLAEFFL